MSELPHARVLSNPLLVLALSVSAGISLSGFFQQHLNAILIVNTTGSFGFAIVATTLAIKKRTVMATSCLVVAFLCAGIVLSLVERRSIQLNRLSQMYEEGLLASGEPVELTGVVKGQPEIAPDGFYLAVSAESIRVHAQEKRASGTVLLLARTHDLTMGADYEGLELRHGARIRLLATLERDDKYRNPGGMRLTEYLERKGFDATGIIKSPLLIERLEDEKVFLPLAWLYEWRGWLEKEFATKFSAETSGVLNAALLGNRYNISQSTAERLRSGGTFHVLVIAGLHISFVAGVLFLFSRWLFRRKLWQFLFAVTVLWGYVIAIGFHEPIVRAASMFTLAGFAPLVGRRASSLNVIGGVAILLLASRPNDLFDPSFQLTLLSVLSIVCLAVPVLTLMQRIGAWKPTLETPYPPLAPEWFRRLSEALFWNEHEWQIEIASSNIRYRLFKAPIAKRLGRWRLQRPLRYACAAIVVSLGVQIGMLPALIIYFHRVSIASPLLNIFVGGLLAMLAFLALTALALSNISLWLAAPVIFLAEKIDWLMIHLVDPFSRFGLASIRLPNYSGWGAFVYVLNYVALLIVALALARWNPLRLPPVSKLKVRTVPVAMLAMLISLAVIIFHPFSAPGPDGKFHVDFLDVGQGDSALLTMPDGTTALIDGGGKPNFRASADDVDEEFERDTRSIGEGVVSEFLWARGLDRVDYLIPTHADADHMDGLNDVARNFKVRAALVARTPADDAEYDHFAKTMRDRGVPVIAIGAGDTLQWGSVNADVLWPLPAAGANAPWRNNDGLVLRIRHGDKTFLFTADIEKLAEGRILSEDIDLHSDLIKVAHHGSRTSSTEGFVNATRPSLAIISVGRTSIFGHPHREVVERWVSSGAKVMTTGEKGTITVVTDGRELRVRTFVP